MKIILTTSLFLSFSLPFLTPTDWELQKDEAGIQVYTRKVEGETLKEYRAEALVPASPEEIVELIQNINKNILWIDKCLGSKILAEPSKDEMYVYNHLDSPWPVADRDLVAHFLVERQTGQITITLTGSPDFIPPKSGIVRIPKYLGKWTIIPMDDTYTKVINTGQVSPGGSIPDWLANSAVVESPYATLANLRSLFQTK